MRPPLDPKDDESCLPRHKRRAPHTRLCIKGVCSVYGNTDVPMSFSDSDKADYLDVSSDGLKVCYKGPGREEKDAASVRTDVCIPTHGIGLYYYEIAILDQGNTGRIGLGLCDRNVKLEKMPGWESGSYAYHGDDGLLFRSTGVAGVPYSGPYGTDDVIGCCWDVVDNVVFFTKNGKNLGVAFRNLKGSYYPTVGMQSTGGQIHANFGSQAFIFDIEAFAQRKREDVLSAILTRKLSKDYRILSDTVLSYLMHNGYSRTAAAFAKDAGREHFFLKERDFMMQRQAVCDKVLSGDIDGAISDVEKQFPQVLKRYLEVRFLLHTQKFIEMIVNGSSPEDTVEYGRKELSVFRNPDYVASQTNHHITSLGNDVSGPEDDNDGNEEEDDEDVVVGDVNDADDDNEHEGDDDDDDEVEVEDLPVARSASGSCGGNTGGAAASAAGCGGVGQSQLSYSDILRDVYLLLAYGDPSKSPTGYLTKQNRREMVADRLNSAILASQGRPMRSVLERVICQNRSVLGHLLSMDNGPASMVSEQDVLTF